MMRDNSRIKLGQNASTGLQTAGSKNLEKRRQRQAREKDHDKGGHTGKISGKRGSIAVQRLFQLLHQSGPSFRVRRSGRAALLPDCSQI